MSYERLMVLGLHFLQPTRYPRHLSISDLTPDPSGEKWTERINGQTYRPISRNEHILKSVSFDMYGVLRQDLKNIDITTVNRFDDHLRDNGVGDCFSHVILPHQTREVKEILIGAGQKSFQDITGVSPKFIWPPETALDYQTLDIFAQYGYKGVICGPEQVNTQDGSIPDNHPYRVDL